MKNTVMILIVLLNSRTFSQSLNVGHMPPPHDHHTSICYGYAMARVYAKNSTLECNPALCYANGMDANYFTDHPGSSLIGIQDGDIITWTSNSGSNGHAAYVISVPQPLVVGNILIQQVPFENYPVDPPMYVRDVNQGPILGYWRLTDNTKYYLTVANSFGSGKVRVGRSWAVPPSEGEWVEYNSGTSFLLHKNTKIKFMAIASQVDQDGNSRNFQRWLLNDQNDGSANPHAEITLTNTANFQAEYNLIFNVTPTSEISGSLEIGPEDQIMIEQNGKLTVTGELTIIGTASDRHVLAPLSGTWQGIEFSGSPNSSLQYCDINYANEPIKATNTSNLTISNCTIGNSNFGPAAAIALYGSSVNISSTTINGYGGSWSGSNTGIRFSQGSSGTVQGTTIQNNGAGGGITITGNSYPTISGNTIQNNAFEGILVLNNGVNSNGPNNPRMYGNTVLNNGIVDNVRYFDAIIVYASSAIVRQNGAFGSVKGINCDQAGIIWTEEVNSGWWDRGENVVNGNTYGLTAGNYSTALFGRADYVGQDTYYYGACNSLFSNDVYDAMATSGSVIHAVANHWGQYPPNGAKISGAVFYDPASQYPGDCDPDYGGGGCEFCPSAAPGSETSIDELNEGLRAFAARDYVSAKNFYQAGLTKADRPEKTNRALSGLYHTFSASRDQTIFSFMAGLAAEQSERGYYAAQLLARMQTSKEDFDGAIRTLNSLKQAARGSNHEKQALIQLASLRGYKDRYSDVSTQALNELEFKFGSEVDRGLLAALGSSRVQRGALASNEQKTEAEGNLSSFPNPFNPMTRMQFTLNEESFVSLRVYDILGREVAALLNEQKAAGRHNVAWEASRQPSGIYFARLEIAGKSSVKKLLLVK
ncbi:MAG: right-handed parallel beta-helix repeat-containing protein [Ignavibacteriales bacterium]|nr:right-handed parallel beta-helix repeat-containing protein [Ignavibacteriales bacterium]